MGKEEDVRRYKVAVIGAGSAGLACARSLLSSGPGGASLSYDDVIVIEESGQVGGLWNLEKRKAGEDCSPVFGCKFSTQPIYSGLTTNLPNQLMAFSDFPYDDKVEMFPHHSEVQNYLQRFASAHSLEKCILFKHRVVRCSKSLNASVWRIEANNLEGPKTHQPIKIESEFLAVCSGHQRIGFVPDNIPGLQGSFKGKVLHSSAFMDANDHVGETVLVVGGSISGSEIALKLAQHDSIKIIVSVRKWTSKYRYLLRKLQNKPNVQIRGGIKAVLPSGAVEFLSNGDAGSDDALSTNDRLDTIIFATGYQYDTNFLENPYPEEQRPWSINMGRKMSNLYMRMFWVTDPSLAFLGITNGNFSPVLVFEYQARFFATVVRKGWKQALPDTKTMMREIASREDDPTQDELFFQCPSYCNSLAAVSDSQGYWSQVFTKRVGWLLRSYLKRKPYRSGLYVLCVAFFAFVMQLKLRAHGNKLGLGLFSQKLTIQL